MRIPFKVIEKDFNNIEKFLDEKLRVVGNDNNSKVVVFRRDQWQRVDEAMSRKDTFPISEASSVVIRAYSGIISSGSAAKSTPAGKMALYAAILSLYNADPGLGSNLTYLID